MAIREDIVASAAQFLQDPSVASSPIENRISFLRNKNLTQEEIDAALARAGPFPTQNGETPPAHAPPPHPSPAPAQQPQQQYYQPQPNYAWQQPPAPVPRRDWRDWFIMATMMGGLSYGLYTVTKRYIYPMIAPPTPERLEQDKKTIAEQFDKTFALVEQLARDTEALKAAEKDRTERLDTALSELESVMSELKSANRRREDDSQRIRSEIQGLKDSLPAALEAQKSVADTRLKEVNAELLSLKALISRMNAPAPATPAPAPSVLPRTTNGNVNGGSSIAGTENAETDGGTLKPSAEVTKASGRSSPNSNGNATGKVSIPAWQLAMASKGDAEASGSS
ncbi:related to peroxisomal membrane protein per10 [Cephalotrichum gorgonifer]|uniref:Peroxisomal membrane protein PEX14 n=1 Tax=Cephalotrichum gorgonifer TaxID=2041049 RepID=A0AAE8N0Q0_9PEZI|nr:related to peroxisomal membrane protein per10 [Cephalotrichum gorgonifer]